MLKKKNKILAYLLRTKKLGYLLDKAIIVQKNFKINDTILIAGSPRAGTTWLMNLLSEITGYTTIFEPLHALWFPELNKVGFGLRDIDEKEDKWLPRYFLDPKVKSEEIYKYFAKIFSGGMTSTRPFFKEYNISNIFKRYSAQKLIIKTIRGNLLLPWIANNLSLRANILLVRHPCSTIASQLKSNISGLLLPRENFAPQKDRLIEQANELGMGDLKRKLRNLTGKESILAATWALDYYIPLVQYNDIVNLIILSYEDLLRRSSEQIDLILRSLKELDEIDAVLSRVNTPSKTTSFSKSEDYDVSQVTKANYQLTKWASELSDEQIANISKVLEWFGIEFDLISYKIGKYKFPRDNPIGKNIRGK